ncbi:MAG TPA: M43 family zinc metalloprotease [Panacibacter sp.]|nr:M43 family zinc metalloprotease [Panacibacter sp.]
MKPLFYLLGLAATFAAVECKAQNKNAICSWKNTYTDFRLPKNAGQNFEKVISPLPPVTDNGAVYTLPVIVHVIHTGTPVGSPDNPSTTKINAMIKNLNSAFRKKGAMFGGAVMNIQFKLATKSPGCAATTGMERINGSGITNYTSGGITNINYPGSADEVAVKGLSRWPNTDYINIWIVNKINGSATNPGGYAYFPEYNSALTDGLVLQASVVDSTNKTIVHEMGHFFSLYHTFYDDAYETTCATNSDCANQGDKVCDTEVELNVPCGTSTNSCNSNNAFIIADAAKHYTVLNNFMGYTTCQWMFTEGQKTRARAALFNFRYGLITSGGLSGAATVPAPACVPTVANGLSPYYGVQKVEFNTLSVYSNSSLGDSGNYVDRTCNQTTTVMQGKSYALTVTGSYGNPHRFKVFIDYNNDGDFADVNETIATAYIDTLKKNILIPATGVLTGIPLRMRVVADNPTLPAPTACTLNGTVAAGAGQAEDYSIIIMPAQAMAATRNSKTIKAKPAVINAVE